MAGRFNEIQYGRIGKFLSKFTGIKGPSPSPQMAGEVMPVIQIPSGVEDRYLQNWDTIGLTELVAAGGAGTFSMYRIRNPAASNILAVFTRISLQTGLNNGVSMRYARVDAGNLSVVSAAIAQNYDNRGRPQSSLVPSFQALAGPPNIGQPTFVAPIAPNVLLDILEQDPVDEIPLPPGSTFDLLESVANDTLRVNFRWRERFLEDAERF